MVLNEQGHEGVRFLKSFIRGSQQFMDQVGTGPFEGRITEWANTSLAWSSLQDRRNRRVRFACCGKFPICRVAAQGKKENKEHTANYDWMESRSTCMPFALQPGTLLLSRYVTYLDV